MKLKKSILVIISAMTLLCSNFTSVFASDEAKDTTVNITADLSNSNYTKIVSKIFEDPDVSTVNVIDPTLEVDDFKENIGIAPYKYTYYEATGKRKYAGNYTGTTVIAQAKGGPGVTLQIAKTKGISNTYSCSVPVNVSTVNSVVGFSVTSSENITISGSTTVPSVHKNKKVKSMVLTAYPYYQKYTYSVIKITSNKGMILKQKAGTGSASRATGCTYKRTYTYK